MMCNRSIGVVRRSIAITYDHRSLIWAQPLLLGHEGWTKSPDNKNTTHPAPSPLTSGIWNANHWISSSVIRSSLPVAVYRSCSGDEHPWALNERYKGTFRPEILASSHVFRHLTTVFAWSHMQHSMTSLLTSQFLSGSFFLAGRWETGMSALRPLP
jgi:hypothetical protein